MTFSDIDSDHYGDIDTEIFDNKTEKELVKTELQRGNNKGFYSERYTAVYCFQDQDMDRVVLFRIPKEIRRAGK